jgi:putative endonuclease
MYFLYILQSKKTLRHYIGHTANVENRLQQHSQGGTRSTKPYRPWRLIYAEQFENKTDAAKREWHLKHPAGYLEKRRIIEQYSAHP